MDQNLKIVENGLIPIYQKEDSHLIDARQLHANLEIIKPFADWIKDQIYSLGLVENVDFTIFSPESEKVGRPSVEYAITLDTAKHIALASRTEKGKAIRQYFIEAEKKLRQMAMPQLSVLDTLKIAVKELEQKEIIIQEKNKQIEEMKPAVDFVENVFKPSSVCRRIGEFAKTASFKLECGEILGPNKLFELLRQMGILMWGNIPKAEYIHAGYFELKENVDRDKNISFKPTPLLTTKGQEWLYKKVKKYLGV